MSHVIEMIGYPTLSERPSDSSWNLVSNRTVYPAVPIIYSVYQSVRLTDSLPCSIRYYSPKTDPHPICLPVEIRYW